MRHLENGRRLLASALLLSACAPGLQPKSALPSAPPPEAICAERDRARVESERAEVRRAITALDDSYGEKLLPLLTGSKPDERHMALERYARFPDLLPRRRDVFQAVATLLDDETVAHSKDCKDALAGSYMADGIRFAQARCSRDEQSTYGSVAGALLREIARDSSQQPLVDDAIVAHVFARPRAADVASPWLTGRWLAIEKLTSASTDAQRLALLQLGLDGDAHPAGDTHAGLEAMSALVKSGTTAVRVRAAFAVLKYGYIDREHQLASLALAALERALDDDTNPEVEDDFARWAQLAEPLAPQMLARFRRRKSLKSLRSLAAATWRTPVSGEFAVVVAALQDPTLPSPIHEECLRLLLRFGQGSAAEREQLRASGKSPIFADVRRAPDHLVAAVRVLETGAIDVSEPEFVDLVGIYGRVCPRKTGMQSTTMDSEGAARCSQARESLVRLAVRLGYRFGEQ